MTTLLSQPEADEFGFVKTLNQQGFMTNYLDEFSEKFVDFSASSPLPVLDIGAAFGVASIQALKLGATVVANDLDPRHLEILKQNPVAQLGSSIAPKLKLQPGRFPEQLSLYPDSLSAVLACRVLHFLDGTGIEEGVRKVYSWLSRGGRFFVVSETPYVGGLQSFIPTYEQRKALGARWPGLIQNFQQVDPSRSKDLPKLMHLLDEDVLRRVFEESGFRVLEARKFARPNFPPALRLDGRESVGIIGVKD